MAKIPQNTNTTAAQIDAHWEQQQDGGNRAHLGASLIGRECHRALWYTFRWATRHHHSGRLLRLFDRGQQEESRFNADLRRIGCTVYEVDPQTGQQFTFSDIGGHFGGSMDSSVLGIPEAAKSWHVCEMKTHGDKSFKDLVANKVEKSKPEHAAQMQCYMGWSGMERALYLSVNKNDDTLYTERLRFDADRFKQLLEKAKTIITRSDPLERMNDDPQTFYKCKWCDYQSLCTNEALPQVTCRTCAHATPELDGDARWSCARYNCDLSTETQRNGVNCPHHRYIPALLPYQAVDANEAENWIEYQHSDTSFPTFRNGTPGELSYSSEELRSIDPKLIGDPEMDNLRTTFNAKVA